MAADDDDEALKQELIAALLPLYDDVPVTRREIRDTAADIMACFLALADALQTKGVLTKGEIAQAFQERLLSYGATAKPESQDKWVMLRMLAMWLERDHPPI